MKSKLRVISENLTWRPVAARDLLVLSSMFEDDWSHRPASMGDVQDIITRSQRGTAYIDGLVKPTHYHMDIGPGGCVHQTLVAVGGNDVPLGVWVSEYHSDRAVVKNLLLAESEQGKGYFKEIILSMSSLYFDVRQVELISFEVALTAAPVHNVLERYGWEVDEHNELPVVSSTPAIRAKRRKNNPEELNEKIKVEY